MVVAKNINFLLLCSYRSFITISKLKIYVQAQVTPGQTPSVDITMVTIYKLLRLTKENLQRIMQKIFLQRLWCLLLKE